MYCLLTCPQLVQAAGLGQMDSIGVLQFRNCSVILLLLFQKHNWSHRGGTEGVQHDVQVSCRERMPVEYLGDISGTWMAPVHRILWLFCL